MTLVWLFKEHRDIWAELHQTRLQYESKILQLEQAYHDQVIRSDKQIADLEEQLTRKPVFDLPNLVEELFQDRPYEGGKIPDDVWLTPGKSDR